MNKTDKELAVELTIATMNMVTYAKNTGGGPAMRPLDQQTTNSILNSFYQTLTEMKSDK
jgi:hypothetical protein